MSGLCMNLVKDICHERRGLLEKELAWITLKRFLAHLLQESTINIESFFIRRSEILTYTNQMIFVYFEHCATYGVLQRFFILLWDINWLHCWLRPIHNRPMDSGLVSRVFGLRRSCDVLALWNDTVLLVNVRSSFDPTLYTRPLNSEKKIEEEWHLRHCSKLPEPSQLPKTLCAWTLKRSYGLCLTVFTSSDLLVPIKGFFSHH